MTPSHLPRSALGLAALVVALGCACSDQAQQETHPETMGKSSSLLVCIVDVNGNMIGEGCDGGSPPAPPDAGTDAEADAGTVEEEPACSGLPTIEGQAFNLSSSYKSKELKCPNGSKAQLAWTFSATANASANPNNCSANGTFKGNLDIVPTLCGRVGGSVAIGVSGSAGVCLTPECDEENMIARCVGPACTTANVSLNARANLHASWQIGDILPPARAVSSFVDGSITVDLLGQGTAARTTSSGKGRCGCCPNGASQDFVDVNGALTGTVTGRASIDLGWIGNAELTATGTAHIEGKKSWGQTCGGTTDEMSGCWSLSASVSGRGCIGKGWIEYCRDFSAGPWTVGSCGG